MVRGEPKTACLFFFLHLVARDAQFQAYKRSFDCRKEKRQISLHSSLSYYSLGLGFLICISLELQKKIEGNIRLWRFEDWDTIGEPPSTVKFSLLSYFS